MIFKKFYLIYLKSAHHNEGDNLTRMNTLKIDLWTKDMKVDDMKRFYVDCIGGIGQSVLNSTGDEYISKEVNKLCDKLINHLKNNESNN